MAFGLTPSWNADRETADSVRAAHRARSFSYVVAPVECSSSSPAVLRLVLLFTRAFFSRAPLCAANWYVKYLAWSYLPFVTQTEWKRSAHRGHL